MTHDFPNLETAARLLGGVVNGDQILCPGPGHSAGDRSLSVKLDPNAADGFLTHSFSGDNPIVCRDYARSKLGLPAFKPNGKERFSEADIERAVFMAASSRSPKHIAAYDYIDADGTALYQKRRYLNPRHKFDCWRPDGIGGWVNGMRGVDRRVLYRLTDVLKGGTVFFCEGEKDADNLAALGLCATTIVGAGSWTDECVQALKGRDVVILRDNDDAGVKRAQEAAEHLHGVADRVRVCLLPDLAPKGDVTDWIDAGGTADKLQHIIEDLPDWEPTETDQRKPEPDGEAKSLIQSSRRFVAGYTPPDYLVHGLLLEAFLYCLTGATGAGKTAITLRLAASIALGIPFAGRKTKKRRMLYLAAENPVDIRMRWIALAQQMDFDADTIEVYFIEGVFRISKMTNTLKAEAERIGGEFGLIIVDTGPVFYEGDDENNRNQQGKHAELLRGLISTIPGNPSVLANVHPVKNATHDNLLPAGGGNFLNQVDGNLTAAKTDSTTELHWQGKFRGVEFAPIHFLLRTVTHQTLKDSEGGLIPTVVCDWISDTAKEEIAKQKLSDEDQLLAAIAADPNASLSALAIKMGWKLYSGEPNKVKASRCIKDLKAAKLIRETRAGKYHLTDNGEKALKGDQQ